MLGARVLVSLIVSTTRPRFGADMESITAVSRPTSSRDRQSWGSPQIQPFPASPTASRQRLLECWIPLVCDQTSSQHRSHDRQWAGPYLGDGEQQESPALPELLFVGGASIRHEHAG